MHVAIGPVMADVTMAGIQIFGLRTMLPICSMLVPRPWLTRPPQPFSRKLSTAKPTMFAQQPATAAPPASPVSESAAQMAAEAAAEAAESSSTVVCFSSNAAMECL